VLRRHGVVSQESATAMARAIREQLGADVGIGLTGVPGPSAVEGKPAGLAYLAIAGTRGVLTEQQIRVPPRRVTVKRRVSNTALIELCKLLSAAPG
jgi:nicotinamide-nucleotide amidase